MALVGVGWRWLALVGVGWRRLALVGATPSGETDLGPSRLAVIKCVVTIHTPALVALCRRCTIEHDRRSSSFIRLASASKLSAAPLLTSSKHKAHARDTVSTIGVLSTKKVGGTSAGSTSAGSTPGFGVPHLAHVKTKGRSGLGDSIRHADFCGRYTGAQLPPPMLNGLEGF